MRRKTTKQFIRDAIRVHGDQYIYEDVQYENTKTPVAIKCIQHGVFFQTPNMHLRGNGCPTCGISRAAAKRMFTTKQFIKRARKIHGDKYDYSKVQYRGEKVKVLLLCNSCKMSFYSIPNSHLHLKSGCPYCGGTYPLDTAEFIRRSILVHGNLYNYSLVDYKNITDPVNIVCRKHGVFKQRPKIHYEGSGCPRCRESKGERAVRQYLEVRDIQYKYNYRFKDCIDRNPLPFDFYLPDYNICIEFDGIHHLEEMDPRAHRDLDDIQRKDLIKDQYCLDKSIKLIRISYIDIDKIDQILDTYLGGKRC